MEFIWIMDWSIRPAATTMKAGGQCPPQHSKEVFEYVNQANSLPVTNFAFAANPRNDAAGPRDGSVPRVEPLLRTEKGEALVSIVRYMAPARSKPVREVMISTITNAAFLIHSQVLAYEFINWVTQGVFVGGRRINIRNSCGRFVSS